MERRTKILIFLLFLVAFGYFFNGGGGNPVARLNQTRAIVERGHLYVDGVGFPTDDQIRIHGHSYSSKAPGTSLLGVIPYAVFSGATRLAGLHSPFWKNFVVHMTTLVAIGIPCALAMLALYLFLTMVGVSAPRALLATAAVGFGTTFFPYATMYFGHSLAGSLAFLSFYLLRSAFEIGSRGECSWNRVFYAALLVGYAVITEYPAAIISVLLTVYLLTTRPTKRDLLSWFGGGGVAVVSLAIYNWLAFGSPLALSYLNYQHSARNVFPQHSKGLAGITWPKWEILTKILWSDERGLVWFSPVLVLVVPALLYMLARRRDLWREGLVIATMVAAYLALNAGYGESIRYWGGANSAGPRHLIPMYPFAGVAIGLLIGAAPWVCVWVIIPSVVICLAITSVMPQVPMLYRDPLEQFIFPYFLEGRLAVHRGGIVSRELVTHDSIAYNLGKLFGLDGPWSLVPLFVVATLLVHLVLASLRARALASPRGSRFAIGVVAALFLGLVSWSLLHQRANASELYGPGVLAMYHHGKRCDGRPVKVTREPDLSFNFQREDIRPNPSRLCARWKTLLKVPRDGTYTFAIFAAPATLWIDGEEVANIPDRRTRSASGRIQLTEGAHVLEVEAKMIILKSKFFVRWRPPGGRLHDIPAKYLTVPIHWVRG